MQRNLMYTTVYVICSNTCTVYIQCIYIYTFKLIKNINHAVCIHVYVDMFETWATGEQ